MILTTNIKERLYKSGFNVVELSIRSNVQTIYIVVFMKIDGSLEGRLCETDLDIFNSALKTCKYGIELSNEEIFAFFPKLKENIQMWKKKYPRHF